ncbi:MAG: AtpZ/AtpI family protein [Bacteroidetes bacterium]|nr:AtpZ/AtpI family protein [Bacteroidota bacterium]MBL6962439.1 AtpZ/AtpI family protein [Bacteroidota bacterium]
MRKIKNKQPFYIKYISLGVQILATVLLGVLLGQWLDRHFMTNNSMYTIIFSSLMIIVALVQLIRTFLK